MIRHCLIAAGAAVLLTWTAAAGDTAAPATSARTDDVQDLLYMAEKRPFRIRLHLGVGGEPIRKRWERFMARLFRYADVDDDKVLSKTEAARLPSPALIKSLLDGQFLGTSSPVHFDQLDADKDGKVTLRELIAYYNKSGCGPVQALPDRDRGAGTAQLTDALFKHLDPKGTGKLSKETLRAAKDSLFLLDTNEDELISAEELLPGSRFGFFGSEKAGKDKPAPLLALVHRDEPAAKQAAPLLARYDKDKKGKLRRADIALDEATFVALDVDKDGGLDANELAKWLAQSADLELHVPLREPRVPLDLLDQPRFAPDLDGDLPIEVRKNAGLLSPAASLSDKRGSGLTLKSECSFIEFQAERSSQWSLGRRRYEFLQKFQAAQRGEGFVAKKAALRNRELGSLFACLDRNGDGKITEEEFGAFFDLLTDVNRCFTVVMLNERGPCLFELLDANRDKHLGARELADAWKNLATWDVDKDGAISKQEVPRLFQVTLSCGRPARLGAIDGVEGSLDLAEKEHAGPLWFRTMDVNGDGDISRREWLGSEEDFRRIDTDGNGLIDAQEAARADAWFRQRAVGGLKLNRKANRSLADNE
jgi:Ca2+-binding EF-hand superfamily protein